MDIRKINQTLLNQRQIYFHVHSGNPGKLFLAWMKDTTTIPKLWISEIFPSLGNLFSKMRFVYLFFVCFFSLEKLRERGFRNSKLSAVSIWRLPIMTPVFYVKPYRKHHCICFVLYGHPWISTLVIMFTESHANHYSHWEVWIYLINTSPDYMDWDRDNLPNAT